ncbi:MAG: hypothetical protein LC685_01765 [Actinobacteria bacterium]|nr:hypothetical protein [Actinomycetota bacterium]
MARVPPKKLIDQRASVRRVLSWALVAALCVAALTAIGAILSGDFDETDGRVIATSLGFAVFSATAASGASLRFREAERLRMLGLATMALSGISFVLLVVALWSDGDDEAWRWFGSAALAALACSHGSLVSGALRPSDTAAVRALAIASIGLGVIDSFFGILALSGAVDDVGDGFGQLMAVLVVLLLLSTALPPILRRLQRPAVAPAKNEAGEAPTATQLPTPSRRGSAPPPLAAEVLAAADRIEALNGDPGNRTPDIRRECERLRQLARMDL